MCVCVCVCLFVCLFVCVCACVLVFMGQWFVCKAVGFAMQKIAKGMKSNVSVCCLQTTDIDNFSDYFPL